MDLLLPSTSRTFHFCWERFSGACSNGLFRQSTSSKLKYNSSSLRLHAKHSESPEDEYGPYPWDSSWQNAEENPIDWFQEDIVTLFTSQGLVRFGGSMVPRFVTHSHKRQKLRRYREEDYMDPQQGLCLGSLFDIAATNGLDLDRRFCVLGYCRSVEMLSDVVEDTVIEQGGEVVIAAKFTSGNLHEKLKMTVAMPLLWGVPPRLETLNHAIRSGGGIVEKTFYTWHFF